MSQVTTNLDNGIDGDKVWPVHVLESFGTWDDVPNVAVIRASYAKDAPRTSFD